MGGKCLSTSYSWQGVTWKCAEGHHWKAPFNSIKNLGSWCPYCWNLSKFGKYRNSLRDCQELAEKKGGRCLSKTYHPGKLNWECGSRHRWSATLNGIKSQGCWCPICGKLETARKLSLGLKEARKAATKMGGRLISTSYSNARAKCIWECANGHQWSAALLNIRYRGGWCPYCAEGSGEECVRLCFEKIFKKRFPKAYPNWLRGGKVKFQEIDGFNPLLGLAFEHQGRHHYERQKGFFQRSAGRFERQSFLDRRKARLCRKNGIRLVIIPEVGWKFPLERLLPEVLRLCRRIGIRIPKGSANLKINYAKAWNKDVIKTKRLIPKLKALARKKGGQLLDSNWLGSQRKYRMRCRMGHVFSHKYDLFIRQGSWCPTCRRVKLSTQSKKTGLRWLKRIKDYARSQGGICLTAKWEGPETRCLFVCNKCGRKWGSHGRNVIKRRSWCRVCNSRRTRRSPSPT